MNIPQEIKPCVNRSIWLYAAVALVFVFSVDYKKVAEERGHYLLGVFYNGDLSNYKDGIVYFDYLISQNDKDAVNYANLGSCYFALEDFSKALRYYEKALQLDPGSKVYEGFVNKTHRKMTR